jgi:coenzyme F420-reducing hydrogenase gamma subunit
MTNFGNGPTLKETFPWLRDDDARIERILTVTEVNSVIEGLPPLKEEIREKIKQYLKGLSGPVPTPAG